MMTKQQAVKVLLATRVTPARLLPTPVKATSARTTLPPRVADEDVRIRAYQLWESAGRPHGQDQQLWLQAEKELRALAC